MITIMKLQFQIVNVTFVIQDLQIFVPLLLELGIKILQSLVSECSI